MSEIGNRQVAEGCPPAVAQLRLDAPGWLEASAGSGKTYAIEHLVLRLIQEGAAGSLPQILLVTYTEKAAGELKEKLRRRIESEAANPHANASARIRLRQAADSFDKASVFTIHAFCLQALQRYAFELGGLFQAQLADEGQLIEKAWLELRREAARDTGDSAFSGGVTSRLTEAEVEAILACANSSLASRLLKLAPAYRPERGDLLSPEPHGETQAEQQSQVRAEIKKAAQTLKAWLDPTHAETLGETRGQQLFEAFAKGRLGKVDFRPKTKALEKLHELLLPQAIDIDSCIKNLLARNTKWGKEGAALFRIEASENPSAEFAEFRQGAESRMADFIASLRTYRDLQAQAPTQQLGLALKALNRKYLALKSEGGFMTYEDMAMNLWLALQRSEALADLLRRQFPFAIVDEFQDTDPVQWAIFAKLYLGEDKPRPLYLVGDPKQAIYGFRGGDLATYLRARQRLHALSGQGRALGLGLAANYRSREELIAAFNSIFSADTWFASETSVLPTGSWCLPTDSGTITYIPALFGNAPKQKCEDRMALPQPIILLELPEPPEGKSSRQREYLREHLDRSVIRHILDLLRHPQSLLIPDDKGGMRPVHAGDLCILVRNHAERLGLEVWMRKLGIPYHVHKQRGLFRSPEAAHLAVVLKALAYPLDADAQWAAHLSEILPPLNSATGHTFGTIMTHSPGDAHSETSADRWEMHPLLRDLWPLASQGKWPLLFRRLAVGGRLQERLAEKRKQGHAEAGNWARYQHLMHRLGKEALTSGLDMMGLHACLEKWRRDDPSQEEAQDEGDTDALRAADAQPKVTVLTMHASKGLEFPVVFLAGGLSASRPAMPRLRNREGLGFTWLLQPRSEDQDEGLANPEERTEEDAASSQQDSLREALREEVLSEDKRLFYVALTRAQFKLYVPLPPVLATRGQSLPPPLIGFVRAALLDAAKKQPQLFGMDEAGEEAGIEPNRDFTITSAQEFATSDECYSGNDLPINESFGKRRRKLASYTQLAHRRKQILLDEAGKRLEPDEIEQDEQQESQQEERVEPKEYAAAETAMDAVHIPSDSVSAPTLSTPLPPGANTGNFLHACLERLDFTLAASCPSHSAFAQGPARDLITRQLAAHGLPETCLPVAAALIHGTLTARLEDPFGGPRFRLCDVTDRLPELEFMLPFGMPGQAALPEVRSAEGYLWGYIDLVFRQAGRYYLLDWKSNTLADYRPQTVIESMQTQAYDLQGRLYALALHRWLKHALPGYDPEQHFGGVYYLYLRGIQPDLPDSGICAWKPSLNDLQYHYAAYLAEYLEVKAEALGAGGLT